MRIIEVNIPVRVKPDPEGLDPIEMRRLGEVVLIAGPNGSGKTRLLRRIQAVLSHKPKLTEIQNAEIQSEQFRQNISSLEESLHATERRLATAPTDRAQATLLKNKRDAERNLRNTQEHLKRLDETINWDHITTTELSQEYRFVDFVPNQLEMPDCHQFSPHQIESCAKMAEKLGARGLKDATYAYIQRRTTRYVRATSTGLALEARAVNDATASFLRFQQLVEEFLDAEIGADNDGNATIFGLRLGAAKLSNGQKVLLQLCVELHAQTSSLKDVILFMDEPENHLHPAALIDFVDKIRGVLQGGQIWIATHSVHLLAHFDPTVIWYMRGGKVRFAGDIPEQVLTGLVGAQERTRELADFLDVPAQLAGIRFAAECLLKREAVQTPSGDPQVQQICDILAELTPESGKLRMLDFGAGKGRLLAGMNEIANESSSNLADHLEYFALEVNESSLQECGSVIGSVYPDDPGQRLFVDEDDALAELPEDSLDLVVMCNVFHEIDPLDWLRLFSSSGAIRTLLRPNGYLLVVEDQRVPVGEKAYKNGFIVFDRQHFAQLFRLGQRKAEFVTHQDERNPRLKAHLLHAHWLGRMTARSRASALQAMNRTAANKIRKLREKGQTDYRHGREHAFWGQQLANTQLALEELGTK